MKTAVLLAVWNGMTRMNTVEHAPLPGIQADKVLADTADQLRWVAGMPVPSLSMAERHPIHGIEALPAGAVVGCPGVPGAYTHMACQALFIDPDIRFYPHFGDVAAAIVAGEVAYGVLPVENSSAGQVGEVLESIAHYGLFIAQSVDIKVEHCLCIHPDTDPDSVHTALSHPQALAQCKRYLAGRGLTPKTASNTSTAAKEIGDAGPQPVACVCSRQSAELYGLRILEEGIEDFNQNYTRFLCLSARNVLLPGADTISIALSLPNEPGYLHKILTRFAACNLDLSRILSMPIASRDFNVLFYLDFRGNIRDPLVARLLGAMYDEFDFFRFLGNFSRIG